MDMPSIVIRRAPAAAPLPHSPDQSPTHWSATIFGEPVPRSGSSEIAVISGAAQLVHTRQARFWRRRALAELGKHRPSRPLRGRFALVCESWSSDECGLCDDMLLADVLERAAVLASRRQIGE